MHSSIDLTIHIFANSVGKDEPLKVLEEIVDYFINGNYMRVKFYDVEEAVKNILPSVNLIKVSRRRRQKQIIVFIYMTYACSFNGIPRKRI